MKSFRLFLESEFRNRIHHNPSIATVKNIAKNNPSGHTRFVLHSHKDWQAGNAMLFTHHNMGENDDALMGHVFHENGKYHYAVWGREAGKGVVTKDEHHDHPIIQRLKKHGITQKSTSLFPGTREE